MAARRPQQFEEASATAVDGTIVAICITTPYWFRYDQPWAFTNARGEVIRTHTDHCSPEQATALCNALPGRQPQHHPSCVIFSDYIFGPDSFGYTLMQSGALAFMENQMRNYALFDLRDHPLPTVTEFSLEVKSGIKECMHSYATATYYSSATNFELSRWSSSACA